MVCGLFFFSLRCCVLVRFTFWWGMVFGRIGALYCVGIVGELIVLWAWRGLGDVDVGWWVFAVCGFWWGYISLCC